MALSSSHFQWIPINDFEIWRGEPLHPHGPLLPTIISRKRPNARPGGSRETQEGTRRAVWDILERVVRVAIDFTRWPLTWDCELIKGAAGPIWSKRYPGGEDNIEKVKPRAKESIKFKTVCESTSHSLRVRGFSSKEHFEIYNISFQSTEFGDPVSYLWKPQFFVVKKVDSTVTKAKYFSL